jgi:hypothetical protein
VFSIVSIWQWAKESIKDWVEKDDEVLTEVVVFGAKKLSQKIVEYLAGEKGLTVHVIADSEKDRFLKNFSNVHFHYGGHNFIEASSSIDFSKISHIFITWKEREEVIKTAIYLKGTHPHISLFIRVFDEVIADVVRGLGAHDFSTSAFAFRMLQSTVHQGSPIYLPPRPLDHPDSSRSLIKRRKEESVRFQRRRTTDIQFELKASSPTHADSLRNSAGAGESRTSNSASPSHADRRLLTKASSTLEPEETPVLRQRASSGTNQKKKK